MSVFATLDKLESRIERITGGPAIRVSATQARERSVRPDKRAMELDAVPPPTTRAFYGPSCSCKRGLEGGAAPERGPSWR